MIASTARHHLLFLKSVASNIVGSGWVPRIRKLVRPMSSGDSWDSSGDTKMNGLASRVKWNVGEEFSRNGLLWAKNALRRLTRHKVAHSPECQKFPLFTCSYTNVLLPRCCHGCLCMQAFVCWNNWLFEAEPFSPAVKIMLRSQGSFWSSMTKAGHSCQSYRTLL